MIRKMMGKKFFLSAALPAAVLVAWALSSALGLVNPLLLPSPSDVLCAAYGMLCDGSLFTRHCRVHRQCVFGAFYVLDVRAPCAT